MKTQTLKTATANLTLAATLATATPVAAEFQPYGKKVLVDWPELSVEPRQDGGKYEVLALYEGTAATDRVQYIITYKFTDSSVLLGGYNCNHSFVVMQSNTNGLYDITCVQENQPGEYLVYYLRGEPDGRYSISLAK